MDQLERDCGVDRQLDFCVEATACAVHEQYKGRTQALAARVDEVVTNLRDDRFAGIEQPRQFYLGGREVSLDQARRAERLGRRCGSE